MCASAFLRKFAKSTSEKNEDRVERHLNIYIILHVLPIDIYIYIDVIYDKHVSTWPLSPGTS